MAIDNSAAPGRRSWLAQPVIRILTLSFLIVSLIPLIVLGVKLHDAAWKNAWREVHEKHRLLAMNLASPVGIYIADKRRMMGMLSVTVSGVIHDGGRDKEVKAALDQYKGHLDDFNLIAVVNAKGETRCLAPIRADENLSVTVHASVYASDPTFIKARDSGEWKISGVSVAS